VLARIDLGEVPYAEAMANMRVWADERRAGTAGDRLFLLSHPPVITYGQRTDPRDLPAGLPDLPTVAVDRGGLATYHGPGQLVGYLVVDVRQRGPVDIVRWLEHGLIDALHRLGLPAVRRDTPSGAASLVGVWTPEGRKLVSIGMRIRGGVTSHGFALNVDPDMSVFRQFVACGLPDVAMTSLAELCAERNRPLPADEDVRAAIATALDT
jgi:lipoyl(octanoyl) transferase